MVYKECYIFDDNRNKDLLVHFTSGYEKLLITKSRGIGVGICSDAVCRGGSHEHFFIEILDSSLTSLYTFGAASADNTIRYIRYYKLL